MFSDRIKQNIVSQLLVTATILSSGAILNVVQLLLHIFVRPFSKKIFNRLMYYVIWTWLARKCSKFSRVFLSTDKNFKHNGIPKKPQL